MSNEITIAPAFEIDRRITLSIDHDLAVSLGRLVLDSATTNKALLALGHQLRNLARDYTFEAVNPVSK